MRPFAAHPTVIVDEDPWFTRGYAFDGSQVLGFRMDRQVPIADVWGRMTRSVFLAGDASAEAMGWPLTRLATP